MAHPIPCPTDDALVFDVEVLMSAGKRPTLACAVSADAWYDILFYVLYVSLILAFFIKI